LGQNCVLRELHEEWQFVHNVGVEKIDPHYFLPILPHLNTKLKSITISIVFIFNFARHHDHLGVLENIERLAKNSHLLDHADLPEELILEIRNRYQCFHLWDYYLQLICFQTIEKL
jgi:hypothetical protein